MSYQVALLGFEGPLDLLLQLVEKSELSITELPLGELTEQYLAHTAQLQGLDPHDLSQFIELATRLVYLKSLALLPAGNQMEAIEGVGQLQQELWEYARYHQAANQLGDMLAGGASSSRRGGRNTLEPDRLPVTGLSLSKLQSVFSDVLSRLPEVRTSAGLGAMVTQEQMSDKLLAYAQNMPLPLRPFLESLADRMELVVAFLALLELVRSAQLSVAQDKQFDDMMVSR
jgi:segregation and condensation protein A